jgi:hypothetical protein
MLYVLQMPSGLMLPLLGEARMTIRLALTGRCLCCCCCCC